MGPLIGPSARIRRARPRRRRSPACLVFPTMRTSTDVRGRRSGGRRRSGWAAAHSCANQCPGCGARPRLGFAARGRCGPSPSALQGRIYLGQNVSEHDVAPVTPIRRSADGERQSLYFAHAMCTDRNLVAGVARARLPYAANMVSEWTQLGVHVARGLEPRRRRRG